MSVANATGAQQAYLKAFNPDPDDLFGGAVAISGNTIVVGADYEDSGAPGVNPDPTNNTAGEAGAAYVFVRSGSHWTQQAYLKASNPGAMDDFGFSVAISGDTIVVGSPYEASNATGVNGNQNDNSMRGFGAAYVFVRSGTNWSQQAYIKRPTTNDVGTFGYDLAISGDTIVATGGQQTHVYVRNGTVWTYQATLRGVHPLGERSFAASVAIEGNTVIVGGATDGYVFVRTGTNWTQQARLAPLAPSSLSRFGSAVAISGNTVVVGDHADARNGMGEGNTNYDSGAAYIFVRSGTTWTQQAYLKASNTSSYDGDFNSGDYFGLSVAIWGDTVVVGARNEDSRATGINGNQGDNTAWNAGAAYVFKRNGTKWTQHAYVKASNTTAEDEFGGSVVIEGDTILVGAYTEDGLAHGVDTSCCVRDSGAVYVFECLGLPAVLTLARDGSGGYFVNLRGGPGCSYRLERATNVLGPWDNLTAFTFPSSGTNQFRDVANSRRQAFYRAVSQ